MFEPKMMRLCKLVLFLRCFGRHNIIMSLISLAYGTWDDYLSKTMFGKKFEEKYQKYLNKYCGKYFIISDGLVPDNYYRISNLGIGGITIVEFGVRTLNWTPRNLGAQCITFLNRFIFYGDWVPLPSALAG